MIIVKDKLQGVRGYKQISLKRFSRTISHNLTLLALSRGQNLYELHDQIVGEFVCSEANLIKPIVNETYSYNVFIGPEAQELATSLSMKLKVTESEIIYSALVSFADKLLLNHSLAALKK